MNSEAMRAVFEATRTNSASLLDAPTWGSAEFCHYTSVQGLVGMIENNEIWLSDHRFVNDPREYQYGKDLAIAVLTASVEAESETDIGKFLGKVLQRLDQPSSSGSCRQVAAHQGSGDQPDV